jgi:hypothetical protein
VHVRLALLLLNYLVLKAAFFVDTLPPVVVVKQETGLKLEYTLHTREKRDLERKCWENIDILMKVVRCVQSRPASAVDSILRSVAVQNLLRLLACFVHNRPPSPKFQILPRQLRLMADRAAGLSI